MSRPQRIIRPDTAFTLTSGRQKNPRQTNDAHLRWIRTLPCVVTGSRQDIQAAHVSFGDLAFAKPSRGKGEKADDKYVVPLCKAEHERQHSQGERRYWESVRINPVIVALSLFAETGNDDKAAEILRQARKSVTQDKRTP